MVGGVLCIVQTPTFHNLAGLQYLIKGAPLGMTLLPLPPQITLLRYGRGRKIATVYTICTCGIYSSTGCNHLTVTFTKCQNMFLVLRHYAARVFGGYFQRRAAKQ